MEKIKHLEDMKKLMLKTKQEESEEARKVRELKAVEDARRK